MYLLAEDEVGALRLVCAPTLRQGGMPHVAVGAVAGFRRALRETRNQPTVLSYERWQELLGVHIPVCDSSYGVTQDGVSVYGKATDEARHAETTQEVEGSTSVVSTVMEAALARLTESVDGLRCSIEKSSSVSVDGIAQDGLGAVDLSEGAKHDTASGSLVAAEKEDEVLPKVLAFSGRTGIADSIESYLLVHGVPSTASRTNLGGRVNSMLLGLYTRRGMGVTKRTNVFPLLEELHALAKTCSIPPSYTSIAINVMNDTEVPQHRDSNNMGVSTVYVCGQFGGGEFIQGEKTLRLKEGWFTFFGQIPHRVARVTGTRVSIIYHVPNG
eukprot:6466912-Amphidinium_carterae.1